MPVGDRHMHMGLFALTIAANEGVGGAIVLQVGLFLAFQFGDDAVGEDFAEFDAPLVEGVDVPDGALDEDFVFVEGDDLAESFGCETVGEKRVGWTVALEGAVWHLEGRDPAGRHILGGLAKGQGFGLGKEVGH